MVDIDDKVQNKINIKKMLKEKIKGNEKKKEYKSESGITIIVLIITIIIMSIIASITINMVAGEEGFFVRSKETKKRQEEFVEKEDKNVQEAINQLDSELQNNDREI